MKTSKAAAQYYTLLSAAIAGLASGQALAETAGHVSFVNGPVTAIGADGQTRVLHRGDDINGGDRINTGSGRAQIRFTDGGFVALQPNTVFGVDQYAYANRKPEESSVFFNLVRGGMRTITGVIGHINKASYRVKTPVATIGIRGTEYLAETDGNSLSVSVGLGSVVVENDKGNITLVSGQSAYVPPNGAPQQSFDTPTINAPGPNAGNPPPTPTAGNQQSTDGLPAGIVANTLPPGPLQSTVYGLPLYSATLAGDVTYTNNNVDGGPVTSSAPAPVLVSAAGNFDSKGNPLSLFSNGAVAFDNTGSSGALQYADLTTEGGLSFGELTDGSATVNGGTVTAANGQYIPFIVGLSSVAPAALGTVNYELASAADATAARRFNGSTTTSGVVNSFTASIDLSNATLSLDLKLTMAGDGSYEVTASKQPISNISSNGFQLTGLSTSGPVADCDGGCSATVSGFFAGSNGSRLGTSYDISTGSGDILGVAALSQVGGVQPSSTAPLSGTVEGSPTYTFAIPANSTDATYSFSAVGASFDQSGTTTGALRSVSSNNATIFSNPAGGTQVQGTTEPALQYYNLVTYNDLSWGEMGDGSGYLSVAGLSNSTTLTVQNGLYVPYIVGTTGPLPSDAIVHYSLVGATPARLDLSLAGVVNHFNLDLDLNALELNADLEVAVNGSTYDATGQNLSVASLANGTSFLVTGLATSGGDCASIKGGCSTNISGFFAGASGSQMGATYVIADGTNAIEGVAALGQTTGNTSVVYVSDSYGSGTATDAYSDSKGLLDATSGGSIVLSRNDSSGTTVADQGSDGTLSWGRWVSGYPAVGSSSPIDSPLNNTDSLHYISGVQTSAAVMSALNSQQATLTYNLEGGTTPTNGSSTGTLNSGQLVVNFGGVPTMSVDLSVSMGKQNYNVNTPTPVSLGSATSAQFALNNLTTSGCASSSCSTNVSGFFAGSQANKIGLGYSINDGSSTTHGAAAFGR